jgi:DNA-binding Lrp family transcriptional regulator
VPGVRACYHVTGQFDMVLELALRDLDHLGQLIRVDIARIPGVMNLETMLIMAESVADEGWPDLRSFASPYPEKF